LSIITIVVLVMSSAGGAINAVVAKTKLPAPAWRSFSRLDVSRDREDFPSSIVAAIHSTQEPGLKSQNRP